MKRASLAFLLSLAACVVKANKLSLPAIWSDDLVISVYTGGGMLYRSLDITYSSGKCRYDRMNQGKHEVHEFTLSATDKQAILKQLHEYGLASVWSSPTNSIAHDKETTRICVQRQSGQSCVQSSATEFIVGNGSGFHDAYQYLVDFAAKGHP